MNLPKFPHSAMFVDIMACGKTEFLLNPIRPGLFSRSPCPGGLRGPEAKNQG